MNHRLFLFLFLMTILFPLNFSISKENNSVKHKIIDLYKFYGLTIKDNFVYASSVTANVLVKINLINYKKNFLYDFNVGWKKSYARKENFKSLHSADIINDNLFLTFYHTNKVIKYDEKNSQVINFIKNTELEGPSQSILSRDKNYLIVSEYHGNISKFSLDGKYLGSFKKTLEQNNIQQPHMIRFDEKYYYVVDTKSKAIFICDENFNVKSKISEDEIDNTIFKNVSFQAPVAISFYGEKFIFVADLTNGIIVLDKKLKIICQLNGTEIKFKKKIFNIPKIGNAYDVVLHKDNLIIANTSEKNLIILNNFIKIIEENI